MQNNMRITMDLAILKAFRIILTSLGLAVLFNFLFFEKQIGLSVLIFAAILLAAVFLFGLRQKLPMLKAWWLALLIIFFAIMPVLRANEFLTFLNLCAILGLLILLARELTGAPIFLMGLRDYPIAALIPFRMLTRASAAFSLLGKIKSDEKPQKTWWRSLKGAIMALPILIIFGMLFSSADLAFSQFIKGFINITISPRTIQYLSLLIFSFVAALSFLSYIFFPKKDKAISLENSNAKERPDKGIEILVFLGLISTLFLVFIGFQLTYLFGGETNIINAGFTYAEYARRGFWELLAVSTLSLIILFASDKYAGALSKIDWKFLTPALILIAEVMVVIFSAFKRLALYIDAYSLTLSRFYAAGFIILLLILFILLATKFIKSKPEYFFIFGALLSSLAFLIVANLINPDAFVARANMKQYGLTGKIDFSYIGSLSSDAASSKIMLYKKLEGEDKKILWRILEKQKNNLEKFNNDWQSLNFSRRQALKLLREIEAN